MSMGVSSRRDWNWGADEDNAAERERSEETSVLVQAGEERTAGCTARDDESGGVGGACLVQLEGVVGVEGVSREGERGKTEESGEERDGESCSWADDVDIAAESVEREWRRKLGETRFERLVAGYEDVVCSD